MESFEEWHREQLYKYGDLQRKADANLEKHKQSPFVDVQCPITGQKRRIKKDVADRMISKKQVNVPKQVFSLPNFDNIDWSK